jgi:hypothetical protein
MMKFRFGKRMVGRSISELRADSGTVRYELDMLLETAERYGQPDAKGDTVGKNMAVESFAVHCRALILFLFGHVEGLEAAGYKPEKFGGERGSDVYAWDYFPAWERDCPEPSAELYHAKMRADKHVAHITTDRRGVNQPDTGVESVWQLQATTNELARAFALFLSKAPVANFDPEEWRKMKARVAPWTPATPLPPMHVIAKSGPLDNPMVNLQARTDARTSTVPSRPGLYGKTE